MSLTGGWLPVFLQGTALTVLLVALGWRTHRWRTRWVPIALLVGVAIAVLISLFVRYQGWSTGVISPGATFWQFTSGVAVAVAILGWRGANRWRRLVSILAVPLCVVCAMSALNTATGYFPTVQSAWARAMGSEPPQWIDQAELTTMVRDGARPTRGTVVRIDTPSDTSGFAHRPEAVYLPPAWFESSPPPKLPTVVMISGEFGDPQDWLQLGDGLTTLDAFAAKHRGYTPVVVFPDSGGKFSNDTECVNGPRGNAEDHLIKEVVPSMISQFGVSPSPSNWGLVGWSAGGTCALTVTVRHPQLFRTFVALDGQLGPNAGTKNQTISRLFGGDVDAWEAFDPKTVIERTGTFHGISGWVGVSDETRTTYHPAGATPPTTDELQDWNPFSEDHEANADLLCRLLSGHGVECSVVGYPGGHDFQSAGAELATALPWLAGRLAMPFAAPIPMPGLVQNP